MSSRDSHFRSRSRRRRISSLSPDPSLIGIEVPIKEVCAGEPQIDNRSAGKSKRREKTYPHTWREGRPSEKTRLASPPATQGIKTSLETIHPQSPRAAFYLQNRELILRYDDKRYGASCGRKGENGPILHSASSQPVSGAASPAIVPVGYVGCPARVKGARRHCWVRVDR